MKIVKLSRVLTKPELYRYISWIIALVAVVAFYKRPLTIRLHSLAAPLSFNGDALQHIAPLWFVHQPVSAVSDYTLRYYLEAILPVGFRSLYALVTLWLSPPLASKTLSIVLSVLFIALSTDTSRRVAGRMSALLTLFLATGGVLKNLYFAGAIQRGFGFFLAALALNLACRSDGMAGFIGVAAVAVIGAAFYPALAPLLLLFLALVLFLPKVSSVGRERLSILKRCILLGASAIFVGVTILPQVVAGRSYGERLSLTRAEAVFEEWGPKGRYTPGDRGVPVNLFSRTFSTISATLSARRIGKLKEYKDIRFPFLMRSIDNGSMVLLAVVVLSLVGLWRRGSIAFSREARVLALFFLASVVAFCLATLTFPLMYIPSRYIALGLIPITAVILPALCSFTVRALLGEARSVPLWILVYGGASIIALGWGDLTVKRMPELSGHTKLFNFIEHLPSGAVVASWPRGIASALPLFTGRPVVVSEEGHQIFHLDVLEEMRRRTRAMIALYAATDSVPVRELRERYQVSYLLINRRHLIEVPEYFEPFGSEMRRAREGVRGRELYLKSLIARRTVFRDGEYMVVDISSE